MRGTIKIWLTSEEYGFIVPELPTPNTSSDVYFNDHSFSSTLSEHSKKSCKICGQAVEFELVTFATNKTAATEVRPIGLSDEENPPTAMHPLDSTVDQSCAPQLASTPNASRQTGKVTTWFEHKNFGFIDDDIYFRRADAEHSCCWKDAVVYYQAFSGDTGKKVAKNITLANARVSQTGTISSYDTDRGFGYIKDSAGSDVFFHITYVRPEVVCEPGQRVEFETRPSKPGREGHEASNVRYPDDHDYSQFAIGTATVPTHYFERWAYFRSDHLSPLKDLALNEDWSRGDPNDQTLPILSNYLCMTFYKLYVDGMVAEREEYAAFNTGLVDAIYRPVFALFGKNRRFSELPRTHQPWYLRGYCISSEGAQGRILADNFSPRPSPPKYFTQAEEVIFDFDQEVDTDNFSHIIIDCVKRGRFPVDFLRSNMPSGFDYTALEEFSKFSATQRRRVLEQYCQFLERDAAARHAIKNRVDDAVALAVQRCRWNYKTAIPIYNPRENSISLLLPIALGKNDEVDLALVVKRTPAGGYRAMTMYLLKWAYDYARLVCRPDSDWLTPTAGRAQYAIDRYHNER